MISKTIQTSLIILVNLGMLISCSIIPVMVPNEYQSRETANLLFQLALRENGKLKWDDCLAQKAVERARWIRETGDFSYDRIGKPWDAVRSCFKCKSAAENLAKGNESAETLHRALCKDVITRKNLTDVRFSLIGIGCHEGICVELFAGF
ncbi:MAG: CAP domain-containing protein [Syntrophobacteraceae bacterium]